MSYETDGVIYFLSAVHPRNVLQHELEGDLRGEQSEQSQLHSQGPGAMSAIIDVDEK